MNPFRSRKKSVGEHDTSARPSIDHNAPPMPTSSTSVSAPATTVNTAPSTGFRGRTFRRKKDKQQQQQPAKKEIDLATALPSSDDFRTSLIMPNLSARFSMLREQDDPNSKLGKASDDSVLFPKRMSRLHLFDGPSAALGDIVEVSSISGSVRPPFAHSDRTHSYASTADGAGYGTDDETGRSPSVMSRAKPGQGNKFFGGRQKIYKIPVAGSASAKDLGDRGTASEDSFRPLGKAVYEDDVNISAYQAMRLSEKEAAREALGHAGSNERLEGSPAEEVRNGSSMSLENSHKRETASSTNSAAPESRSSTAATSVASQNTSPKLQTSDVHVSKPVVAAAAANSFSTRDNQDRGAKPKRLYGQGIDQQIHEQQFSAIHRLNSIQRGNGNVGAVSPYADAIANQSRSGAALPERLQRQGQQLGPNALNGLANLSPSGRASPSGLAGFDFGLSGRSRSVSRTNEAPAILRPCASPTPDDTLVAALEPNDVGKATASGAFNKPKTPYSDQQFAQRQLQLQEGRESPTPPTSLRSASRNGIYGASALPLESRLRNGSVTSQTSVQSARSQPQTQSSSRSASAAQGSYYQHHGSSGERSTEDVASPSEPASPDAAGSKPPSVRGIESGHAPRRYEHDDQHPAFQPYLDPPTTHEGSGLGVIHERNPSSDIRPEEAQLTSKPDDLPAPESQQPVPDAAHLHPGLDDLIRGHLRSYSNQSSVYPDSPSYTTEAFPQSITEPDSKGADSPAKEGDSLDEDEKAAQSLSDRAQFMLQQATRLRSASSARKDAIDLSAVGAAARGQIPPPPAIPRDSNDTPRPPWLEHAKGHARGCSTETQKEREDFASELADRRRQVQDNLKSMVGDNCRSRSPSPPTNDVGPAGPMGLSKKPSRGSFNGWRDNGSKAMKIFGVGNSAASSMATAPQPGAAPPARPSGHHDEDRPRGASDSSQHNRTRDGKLAPGIGPSFRDRTVGAERREKFFRKTGGPGNPASPIPSPGSGPGGLPTPPYAKQSGPVLQYPFGHGPPPAGSNQSIAYHPAGRARIYSPPTQVGRPEAPAIDQHSHPRHRDPFLPTPRSHSAMDHRAGPPADRSPNLTSSYFPPGSHPPTPQSFGGYPASAFGDSPRPSPIAPGFAAHQTPPLEHPPQLHTFTNLPGGSAPNLAYGNNGSERSPPSPSGGPVPRLGTPRKRSVNKQDISEPTFLSGTSSVSTVNLPPGASLNNGMQHGGPSSSSPVTMVPPLPPINPRRRHRLPGVAGGVFTAMGYKSGNATSGSGSGSERSTPSSATVPHGGDPFSAVMAGGSYDVRPSSSAEDASAQGQQRQRTRLRKMTSDGSGLNSRARQQAVRDFGVSASAKVSVEG